MAENIALRCTEELDHFGASMRLNSLMIAHKLKMRHETLLVVCRPSRIRYTLRDDRTQALSGKPQHPDKRTTVATTVANSATILQPQQHNVVTAYSSVHSN